MRLIVLKSRPVVMQPFELRKTPSSPQALLEVLLPSIDVGILQWKFCEVQKVDITDRYYIYFPTEIFSLRVCEIFQNKSTLNITTYKRWLKISHRNHKTKKSAKLRLVWVFNTSKEKYWNCALNDSFDCLFNKRTVLSPWWKELRIPSLMQWFFCK